MQDTKGNHIAGTCKNPNCDRPSQFQGYCRMCFDIKKEQILTDSLLKIVNGIDKMNVRLERLENKIEESAKCQQVYTQEPNISNKIKDNKSKNKTPNNENEEEVFIPQVNIPDADVKSNKNRQSHMYVKDIESVAKSLKSTNLKNRG